MASISKSQYTTGVDRPIYKWTNFKEAKGRIASYVSEVLYKTARRDHRSALDVLVYYENCINLLTSLMEESSLLTVKVYAEDYLYYNAVQIKYRMLHSEFGHWLEKEKKAAPKNLLSESDLDENVKLMDADLQTRISKQKGDDMRYGYLQHLENDFYQIQSRFRAFLSLNEEFKVDPNAMLDDLQIAINKQKEGYHQFLQNFEGDSCQFKAYIEAMKEKFKLDPNAKMDVNLPKKTEMVKLTENFLLLLNMPYQGVKCIISHSEVEMDSLIALACFCNSTSATVKELISMLNADFCKLVLSSEEDLSKRWLDAREFMDQHHPVQGENEYEEARAASDVLWDDTKSSSGLPH